MQQAETTGFQTLDADFWNAGIESFVQARINASIDKAIMFLKKLVLSCLFPEFA